MVPPDGRAGIHHVGAKLLPKPRLAIDAQEIPALQSQFLDDVRVARSVFPDKLVVMNNGLWLLLPLVASYLDGICWEGTLSEEELAAPWAQMTLDTLLQYSNTLGLVPMLLSLVAPSADSDRQLEYLKALARKFGFLHYAAPFDYAQGVRTPAGDIVRGR